MSPNALPHDMTERIDAFEAYLRVERRRGAVTIARYRAIVDDFAEYLTSNQETVQLDLPAINRLHCVAYLRSPRGTATEEPSRSIWNLRLAALRSLFQYLVDQEVIVQNPTHRIERHKIASKEPIPPSLSEFLDMVDAAGRTSPISRSRNVAILQVLFNTALRVSELVSLDVDQVDFDAYVFREVRTKGDKRLSAKFPDLVAGVLESYLADRGRRYPVSGPALFLSNRGIRLSVRTVEQLVSRLGQAARIGRPVTPHLLRHGCATAMTDLGTGLKAVQRICGHASQATTERYIHVRAGAERDAIDALGAAVEHGLRSRRRDRAQAA